MDETLHTTLARWADFYLITGTAAAALTGLQFVVQTLLTSDALRQVTARDTEGGVDAFGSPTVVHFTLALVVSALMCMPWGRYDVLRVTLGVVGVAALLYALAVLRRARLQKSYAPVLEDWIFHVILPIVAYAAIVASGVALDDRNTGALFALAAATLLLLCVGIHNAWDTVTWLTLRAIETNSATQAPATAPAAEPANRQPARRRRRGR